MEIVVYLSVKATIWVCKDRRRDVALQVRRSKMQSVYTFISCADKKRTKEAAEWAFDQVKL